MNDNRRRRRSLRDERFYFGQKREIAGPELQDALSLVTQLTQLPVDTVVSATAGSQSCDDTPQETGL